MVSLRQQATKGVAWSAIERFSVQGIQFILSVAIARLVAPSEYGLVAMLGIFIAIAQTFVDSGFSNALIQKKDRSEVDFSTVFYFNVAISIIVYLALFFAAPYIARFYDEPLLESVARWVGLNLIIAGLTIVQRAKLTIALDFKTQAKASLIAVIVSGSIGLYLASQGFGVWALVAQALGNTLTNTFLLWIFARWRPSFIFSMQSFRTLFSFGSKLLASDLLHTIYLNLYSLVIGRVYNSSDVGFYNTAYGLATFPSMNISNITTRAIYPIQCQLQNDDEGLLRSFMQYLRLSCYVIFPLMVGLSLLSEPFVNLLLTEKWLPSAELISILALAYMWYPVMKINNNILNVKGRSDYYLKAEVIKKVVAIAILLITMPYGLRVLCWGVVIYNLLDMIIIIHFTKRVIATSYLQQICNIAPILILNLAMGAVVYGVRFLLSESTSTIQLFVAAATGAATYLLLSYLFRFKELSQLITFAKELRSQNR